MPPRHRLLAIAVAAIWGLNFVAIDASLAHFPPFFLVALRFALIAVPTLIWVPRPDVPVRWLIGYGVGFGILQFLFLYWGMAVGMPAGLASLVLQASAPFTVMLGAVFLHERISARAVAGIVIALGGLTVVGWDQAGSAALIPFLLTLAGAFGWAIGNVCSRTARPPKPLNLTLWMSVVPPIPMLALSLATEGPARISAALATTFTPEALPALAGLAYTVVIATVLGSGVWTWLMAHYPAGVVSPFSMLVPVFGITTAWLLLGENVSIAEIVGGGIVIAGVVFGSTKPRQPRNARTPNVLVLSPNAATPYEPSHGV